MTENTKPKMSQPNRKYRWIVGAGVVVVLIGAMAVDTTVVRIGSQEDVRKAAFSSEAYGAEQYPAVKANVEQRAVPAEELATAITASKADAGKKYGVATSTGPVIPVTFTGIVGEHKANTHFVAVEGMPEGVQIRIQTGPAINGTDLRDATGKIEFGQFKNQIEYQDAGSALNNEVKKQVLAGIDLATLTGKTVTVTGVFKLINPKNWMVTPVRLEIK